MILHIFQSDKGDCLLLEGGTSGLMLCDGGMRSSMAGVVRHELTKLRDQDRALDYVYVSHIDSDHISGVLQLLEDEVAWRVFEFQQSVNHPGAREPRVPRPPVIKGLLQNAFKDLIGANSKDVEDLIAVAVPSLLATADPGLVDVALDLEDLAVSIPEAIKVSRLAAEDALDIPVNRLPGSAGPARLLFMRDEPVSFRVGSMRFTLVGPGHDELSRLKQGWVTWLRANQATVRELRRELRRRVDGFSNGVEPEPFDLRGWNGIPDVEGVTAPNVASLMFMVEEGGRRLLLTGDGQPDIILDGLRRTGFLAEAGLHLDVLKVQHHGSENNLDAEFARHVSARHYVFCGNGLHGNPDARVIDHVVRSRLGPPDERTLAPAADGEAFHLWFSTTADAQEAGSERQRVLRDLEAHCARLRDDSGGRLQLHYNEGASIPLAI
jgi:hypothetical protein